MRRSQSNRDAGAGDAENNDDDDDDDGDTVTNPLQPSYWIANTISAILKLHDAVFVKS